MTSSTALEDCTGYALEAMRRPHWTHMGLGIVEVPLRPGRSVKVVTQLFVMAGGPLSRA